MKLDIIFIKKDLKYGEIKDVRELITKTMNDLCRVMDDHKYIINVDNEEVIITMEIVPTEADIIFLMIETDEYNQNAAEALEQIRNSFIKSEQHKYYCAITTYDGASDFFCRSLSAQLAEFERLLREMIYIIVVKSYGSKWVNETVDDKIKKQIKVRKNGNVSNEDALEKMDYEMLSNYLFERKRPDLEIIIDEKLSADNLRNMNKESICSVIDSMRLSSLWENHFAAYGNYDEWKGIIDNIHNYRNIVAHNKSCQEEDYVECSKQLNVAIPKLISIIEELNQEDFTLPQWDDAKLRFSQMAQIQCLSEMSKRFDKITGEVHINKSLAAFSNAFSGIGDIATDRINVQELSKACEPLSEVSTKLGTMLDQSYRK